MKKPDLEETIIDCKSRNSDDALPPVSVEIIRWLKKKQSMTAKNLAYETCTRRSAIKRHLRKLVASGHVQRHGRGKGTWYTL